MDVADEMLAPTNVKDMLHRYVLHTERLVFPAPDQYSGFHMQRFMAPSHHPMYFASMQSKTL